MTANRQSNFELLRILAMLAIVAGHFVSQSAVGHASGASGTVAMILSSGPRIAVNIFLLVGCWFLVDAKFKSDRLLKLYLELALYTIPLTAVMFTLGLHGETRNIIQGVLPFFGRPAWFATAYISLIALTPFLNFTFRLSDIAQRMLVCTLGFTFALAATIPSYTPFHYLGDFAWFPIIYLLVGYAKRTHLFDRLPGAGLSLAAGIIGWGILATARLTPSTAWAANYWLDNIQSLPNITIAILIFNAFRRMNLGSISFVNILASSTFAVYIVHQVPAFRTFEWNVLCRAETLAHATPIALATGILSVSIGVFLAASLLDRLYRSPLQSLLEKTALFKSLATRLQSFYRT